MPKQESALGYEKQPDFRSASLTFLTLKTGIVVSCNFKWYLAVICVTGLVLFQAPLEVSTK